MTPYQLAVKALKTNPERFLEDSCPIEKISCYNCPFKWNDKFKPHPNDKKVYHCGIDPEYLKNTGIADRLKTNYPEYYL